MPQHDIYTNPSSGSADGIPCVVVVQIELLGALAHSAAPIPAKLLKRPVANVAGQASALVAAMDAVLSGI